MLIIVTTTAIAGSLDADGDGFDAVDGDCNETDADIHPGAVELCSGVDEDCSGIADDDGACPSCETETDGDRQYLFCDEEKTWLDARAACAAVGYEMLSVGSASEDDFVDLNAGLLLLDEWWMGLNDRAPKECSCGTTASRSPTQTGSCYSRTTDCSGWETRTARS